MPPAAAASLVVIGFGAFVALILWWAAKHSERVHRNFTALAQRLGLTPRPAKPKLGLFWPEGEATGELRGKRARLFSYSTGSGKSRVQWTALAVRPRELGGLTFSLTRQGFGSKISQLFGAREVFVGDPTFDQQWFIQTNQPEFFVAALLPELRARLSAVLEERPTPRQPSVKLETDTVVYVEVGDCSSEARCERLARIADVLCDFAGIAEVYAQQELR